MLLEKKSVENTDSNLNFLKEKLNNRSVIIKANFADLRRIWEPYLRLDVLCLAFIYARHSQEMKKISDFVINDCLTEASVGWK